MQYARSKVDYAVGEFIYMLPSNMNLWIGKVKNYNNKILVASPSFKIGTNLKINPNDEKDKPDVKSERGETIKTKPDIESNEERRRDIKMMKTEPDTHEEEKAALILGITSIFTVWWMFR